MGYSKYKILSYKRTQEWHMSDVIIKNEDEDVEEDVTTMETHKFKRWVSLKRKSTCRE